MLGGRVLELMDRVGTKTEAMNPLNALVDDEKQQSRLLYWVLASNVKGKALSFVMNKQPERAWV